MYSLTRSALIAALLAMPAVAAAQTTSTFVSPYLGGTLGSGDLAKSGAPTLGLSAGWMGSRWGFEGDVADSPDFFTQDGFRTDRRVMTVMGSGLYRIPMAAESAIGAYAAGGFGMLRPRLAEAGGLASVDVKQPAFNIGAGITWMKNAVGVRGDVRYIRGLGDEADDVNAFGLEVSTLHYVRATVGLVVGF